LIFYYRDNHPGFEWNVINDFQFIYQHEGYDYQLVDDYQYMYPAVCVVILELVKQLNLFTQSEYILLFAVSENKYISSNYSRKETSSYTRSKNLHVNNMIIRLVVRKKSSME